MSHDDRPDDLTTGARPLPGTGGADARACPPDPADAGTDTDADDDSRAGRRDPERRCILSGVRAPRDRLVRLALGPDGGIAPDVRARAPGRGAWIGVDHAALATALAKGRLKGALYRAFRTQALTIPDDLPGRVAAALRRDALDRLGLEARSGTLVTGSDRIADHARKGAVTLLIHAADASADGNRKLDQAWRVGLGREGGDLCGVVIPAERAILSMALGRENVVHIALITPAAAGRVTQALDRWRDFIGRDWSIERDRATAPCDHASQGLSPLNIEGF